MQEVVEMLKGQGWVTRAEFCKLVGRSDGGNIPGLAHANGVRAVMVCRNGKGEVWMFRPEDASKIPPIEPAAPIPGGENNGGKLLGMISNLRMRVEALEAFKRSLE
jgi:hypothetical protein